MDSLRSHFWFWLLLGMIFTCLIIGIIFVFINMCIRKKGKKRFLRRHGDSQDMNSRKYEELSHSNPPLPPRTQFLLTEAQSYENVAEVTDDRLKSMSLNQHQQNMADVPEHMHILDQKPYQNQDQNMTNLHRKDQTINNNFDYQNENLNLFSNQDQTLTNFDYQNEKLNDFRNQNHPLSTPQHHDQTMTRFQIQDHYLSNLTNRDQKLETLHNQDQTLADLHDYVQIPDLQPDYVDIKDQDEDMLGGVLDLAEDTAEDYDDIGEEIHEEKDYDDIG
ncbi:putative uncharacterized protein DDB_G0279653 [Corythoichthys intestinalis]|uniref:putative uncharacterized protein DDB_G0279653 n=1 Tax=Corythoichthys intestinalis TaxID=161448 RepID=UPI0025A62481|nr:putative uncharacterized protein DDB_G0279653 [Corythoichthys intestinalis]